MINLQDISLLKDVIVDPCTPKIGELYTIEEVNKLLSKGWVLLKIGAVTHICEEGVDKSNTSTAIYDRYSMILGFPRHGIDSIADKYRNEFSQEQK
ncbi:hypothetical protein [Clostridium sp. AWRP]|uniref:hypothetical protein n=1 Tax=Clostridium sp. AWRP TaxID=2212991 RepID=UPI000FDC55EA|nr:hypothetical protein [Clostridium sp. AWRP]AZV56042.1 hypothetical protein DMR38_05200 [Clostridium sp. AWRP]